MSKQTHGAPRSRLRWEHTYYIICFNFNVHIFEALLTRVQIDCSSYFRLQLCEFRFFFHFWFLICVLWFISSKIPFGCWLSIWFAFDITSHRGTACICYSVNFLGHRKTCTIYTLNIEVLRLDLIPFRIWSKTCVYHLGRWWDLIFSFNFQHEEIELRKCIQ